MRVFFAAPDDDWDEWHDSLRNACPEMQLERQGDPADFDAVIYAPGYPRDGSVLDFGAFTRARLVQSLWAGVERIVTNPTLTQPLARMVDPGLTQGMVEYCLGWTLRSHLGMDGLAQDGNWRHDAIPPLASSRGVTVLGLGAIGGAVAMALKALGFDVIGWSASGRPVPGIEVMGAADLARALNRAEVLICLLPDTSATRGMLNSETLSLLPRNATLINAGRGSLIVERDLVAALDAGRPGRAVLDVFTTEPLPPHHPFWSHPAVTVTPHVAAATRASSAAAIVALNLRRAMAGDPVLYLVDRSRGY